MFSEKSFEVFEVEGLEARMEVIRAEIQPVFNEIGTAFLEILRAEMPEQEFYLHIAQHRRRTANAPENTWSGISTQKRGYKMEVHFQLGIWQDYVFVYLSIIDQPKLQKEYAEKLRGVKLPKGFALSKDHTKAEYFEVAEFEPALERLGKVKKSELEIGRVWKASEFSTKAKAELIDEMKVTVTDLIPIYRKLMEI